MKIAVVASAFGEARKTAKALQTRYKTVGVKDADVIVVLGGDGFMLQTIHTYMTSEKPIFGMNCGTVGFLMNENREDDLVEWDYGEYEGRTTNEIREEIPGWSVWTHPVLGGESIEHVGARCDALIDRMLVLDGPIALVAHAHILRVLGARWIEAPPVEGQRLALETTTISILGWERENRVIHRWNDPCGWEYAE